MSRPLCQGDNPIFPVWLLDCPTKRKLRMSGLAPYGADPGRAWDVSAKAAYHLTGYLGISHTLWAEACAVLGEQAAAVCVVLIDHAMHREDNPVRKPNGYFRSRLRKAERGDLHLHRSIFGILERGRGLIDA